MKGLRRRNPKTTIRRKQIAQPRRLSASLKPQTKKKTSEELITLFCLNTLPKQPNAIYKWIDTQNWTDEGNYWID